MTGRRSDNGFLVRRSQRRLLGAGTSNETTIGHLRSGKSKIEKLHTGNADDIRSLNRATKSTEELNPPQVKKSKIPKKHITRRIKFIFFIIKISILVIIGWFLYNKLREFGIMK